MITLQEKIDVILKLKLKYKIDQIIYLDVAIDFNNEEELEKYVKKQLINE